MKLTLLLVGIFSMASQYAYAQQCSSTDLQSKSVYNLPGVGYWMQALGDCRITYTSVGGVSSKMYNMCTQQSESFPTLIDPFPIPSRDPKMREDLYVRPGMNFYNTKNHQTPFYSDPTNQGVYQSVGLLESNNPNVTRVRIAVGWRAGRYKDYDIKRNGDNYDVKPLQDQPVNVCSNVTGGALDSEIPVLSRNGRYIAARDGSNQNTKIYRINDSNGQCDMVTEIPERTGKVSFDFDNEHVMYIMADPVTHLGRLMQLSLKTGVVRTISGPTEDVMYMTSKPNGDILYTRRQAGSYSNSGNSDLVVIKSSDLSDTSKSNRQEVLGLMWAKSCSKEIDLDYAFAVGQRMTSSSCNQIVTQRNYDKLSNDQKRVASLNDLRQLCSPSNSTTPSSTPNNSGSDAGTNR